MARRLCSRLYIQLGLVVLLAGCAGPHISNTSNACQIFAQGNSLFGSWYTQTKAASRRYNIEIPILLATIKAESSFRSNVTTPRHYVLGIIPWGHISSAYGYAQALNGTWAQYKSRTGNHYASRSSFADAVDFIAWYHRTSVLKDGINPHNAYQLYLSYHMGWTAYAKYGEKGANAQTRQVAHEVARQAQLYARQLRCCGYIDSHDAHIDSHK